MSLPDQQFGIQWPKGAKFASEFQRRRYCALKGIGGPERVAEHRKWMMQDIWTEDQLSWHSWLERRLSGICRKPWVTWWGPGSSGKTTDAAALALEWWLELPMQTAVIVCSTTIKMLRKRIWGQIAELHRGIDQKKFGYCGELLDSDTMIRWRPGDTKNGIFGLAVEEGPISEVKNNLLGIHTRRVWWILDEMQGVRAAIMDPSTKGNFSKNPEPKFLGMGNPEDWGDLLGKESEPLAGRESIDITTDDEWETLGGPIPGGGICQVFHGSRSPAILDPEWGKKHLWMINKPQRDAHLASVGGNENDPSFMSQSEGIIPPKGLVATILDDAICETFHCCERAVWTDGFRRWSSLDPSFEGGDRKVLKIGRFAEVSDDFGKRWVISTDETIDVPIDARARDPIHYQIVAFVMKALIPRGITPEYFALDSTGEGGGLQSIFEKEWGAVVGVEFGGNASERPVRADDEKTCRDAYSNRMTELHMLVREFALGNGIRQLSEQSKKEFCARRTFYKNKKEQVEPKGTRVVDGKKEKGFRGRVGYSPDDSDATAIGVELCRQHGAMPLNSIARTFSMTNQDVAKVLMESASEYDSENYLVGDVW